jgi:small subunit ribosomal protein S6
VRERRRDYELMFIVSPLAANEEGVTAAIERVRDVIQSNGGEVTAVNQSAPWGRRKLAYSIREYVSGEASRRNFSEGFYVLMHFSLGAAKVLEVERTIKLTDTILRYLITLVEQKGSAAAAPEAAEAVADRGDAE